MPEEATELYLFANILAARTPNSDVVSSQLALRACH